MKEKLHWKDGTVIPANRHEFAHYRGMLILVREHCRNIEYFIYKNIHTEPEAIASFSHVNHTHGKFLSFEDVKDAAEVAAFEIVSKKVAMN